MQVTSPKATQAERSISQALHERLLKCSPLYFGKCFFKGPEWEPFKGRFLIGPHHLEWQHIVCTKLYFAIQAARGTGKSWFFAYLWPLFLAFNRPGQQFLLLSSTDDNCKKLLREIRDAVEMNPALRWLYPAGKASKIWRSHHLVFSNGFSVVARSALSRIRGFHPNIILLDDALTDDAATSEAYRKKFKDFFFGVVSNMLMRNGILGYSGTPISHKDLISKDLRESPVFHFARFPVLNQDGTSIWPEVIPLKEIEHKRRSQPSILFSREQLCNPISSDVSLFPRHLFTGAPCEVATFTMGQSREALTSAGLKLYFGVDLAFSTRAGADYFVICIVGVDQQGNRWLCDIHRSRGLEFREQLAILTRLGRKYRPEIICIESNAAQKLFSSEMKMNTDLPIYEHSTGTEKHSFDRGLPAVQLLAETKKFRIGRGNAEAAQNADVFLDEMEGFAFIDGKCVSLGEHDDTVMAYLMAEHAIRRGTMWSSVLLGADDKPHHIHVNADEKPKVRPVPLHEVQAQIARMRGL